MVCISTQPFSFFFYITIAFVSQKLLWSGFSFKFWDSGVGVMTWTGLYFLWLLCVGGGIRAWKPCRSQLEVLLIAALTMKFVGFDLFSCGT